MGGVACHDSPFSGSWYPGDASELADLLAKLFARSAERTGGAILPAPVAFVAPHAGLVYSGGVAAAVYRHLEEAPPKRVVILGFSHRGAPAGAWIPEVDCYRTPLGEIPVDQEAVKSLLNGGGFGRMSESALCDHSVEIQLPLLQKAAPATTVVPVYVSSLSSTERATAAAGLARVMGPDTVVIASSDFTHYGDSFGYKPFPLNDYTPARLRLLDEGFIEAAGSLDAGLLLRTLRGESATVCGREPIALLLEALGLLPNAEDIYQWAIDYETSGDLTGDYSHCVSYAALGYFPWSSFALGPEDQRLLLDAAKKTLAHYQETGNAEPVAPVGHSKALFRKAGAFVTLEQNGRLRGCVGRISETEPLAKVVPEMTLAAALEDTRFAPLRPDEEGIELEVSVLSPMKRLTDLARFRVGRDGGYLKAGGFSGLLLPQVAEGRNWTSRDFLNALARKAGVSDEVYSHSDTRLYVFRAQVIR